MRLGTKIIAMLLCIVLGVASVAACGKKDNSKEDSLKAEASAQDTAGNELSVAETDEKADEEEAPTDEREGYEDRVDSLEYIFEDEEIYVLDLCQEGLSVAVLTSDHLAGMVNPVFDEMDHTLRVPEDAVELVGGLSDYSYVIKNQSGEISRYEALTTDRGEILEIVPKIITFEGLTVGNYYFNVSIRGTSYIGYLDGKTLKLSDSGEAEGVPLYLERENLPSEIVDIREIHAGSNTFALFDNNEVYCISTGSFSSISIQSVKSPAPDAAADAEVFSIGADELPIIKDANKIYSIGWWGFSNDYIVYEKVGDSENIHASNYYSKIMDAPDLVFTLPEGYTTADVVQAEMSQDGLLFVFSDGSIYRIDDSKPEEFVLDEEFTEQNKNGHVLEILGGNELVVLMDDHRIYDYSF